MDYRQAGDPFQGYATAYTNTPQDPYLPTSRTPQSLGDAPVTPARQPLPTGNGGLGQAEFTETSSWPTQIPTSTLHGPANRGQMLQLPAPAPVAHNPVCQPQFDNGSPVSRRAVSLTLPHSPYANEASHGRGLPFWPKRVEDIDEYALASELPISSLVQLREPPAFGVIKISNIPYSVTKWEIMQFVGRGAQLIAPNQGCAVHIIMERSTAKTMDCYVEVQSRENAYEIVTRINSIYESGRAPRMGSRHVSVEVSSQDALLHDLFPRAKCIIWNDGIPTELRNTDRFSTGFCGFFTSEEIVGAIRHAEIPHRSPFGAKCPQRTYESTISTLYKFPWYATRLYSVHERNELFTLTNRHIVSLVSRIKRINTMGLDERLVRDLLFAGLNCPAFNDRQKYTLCINAQEIGDAVKFPDMSRWFPFDTLAKFPSKDERSLLHYAKLISQGSTDGLETMGLVNTFPMHNCHLDSPYGRVWFEWPEAVAKETTWEDASRHEMDLLCNLIVSGWLNDQDDTPVPRFQSLAIGPPSARYNTQGSSVSTHAQFFPASNAESSAMASRRTGEMLGVGGSHVRHNTDITWNHKLLLPATSIMGGSPGHRITRSTPACILSSETPLDDEH